MSSCLLSEAGSIRVQIVSDSMAKYVTGIRHTEVIPFPGININRLTNKIQNGLLSLDKAFTIIHVGTNDIHSSNIGEILSAFNNLISVIRQKSPTSIVISAILPRPKTCRSSGHRAQS